MALEDIQRNYEEIISRVDKQALASGRKFEEITIVSVSKTHPIDFLLEGMKVGIKIFGENYVQELKEKYDYFVQNGITVPNFHYIGHLQRNKVKYISSFVDMIQSVDSLRLAEEISKQAEKNNRTIEILLQINTSAELSKSGCEPELSSELMGQIIELQHLKVSGVMAIGSFSEDETIFRKEFRMLKNIKDRLQKEYPKVLLKHISMGMTHDFEAAIEEGATIVRIGTAIFGNRNYLK